MVETINNQKPSDTNLQCYLREFLFHVTTMKFEPVMVKVSTSDNHMADFVSRNYNVEDIKEQFTRFGATSMKEVSISDEMLNFTADW